jgi:hypothetical protein
MIVQILFYRYDYLAFVIAMQSIKSIIFSNITNKIIIVNNINELRLDNNSIIIMFFCDLTSEFIKKNKNRTILINTEQHTNFNNNALNNLEFMNKSNNYFIWEYTAPNVSFLNQNYPNINTYYLPPLYNPCLELYYQETITKKVDYKDKQYDILFMGGLNKRREYILDELKKTYKVKIIVIEDKLSFKEIFDCIENSKIVLNLFYYEVFVFDYYRVSLLLSNNIMMVSEYPYNVDTNIEVNLKGMDKFLIFSDYDNIIDAVKQTLEKSPEEIKNITENTYNWYKQHDMRKYIYDFFTKNFTA